MKTYLYYWFKSVPIDRPGGPWWNREFDSDREMGEFLSDIKPFLHAYCITVGHGTSGGFDTTEEDSPPKGSEIRYRKESWEL